VHWGLSLVEFCFRVEADVTRCAGHRTAPEVAVPG
jgi:hypothetical protein